MKSWIGFGGDPCRPADELHDQLAVYRLGRVYIRGSVVFDAPAPSVASRRSFSAASLFSSG